MTQQNKLLNKYYKAETTLDEEKQLKEQSSKVQLSEAEKDVFAFYKNQKSIPENLESEIFSAIGQHAKKGKSRLLKIFLYSSAAAVVFLALTIYVNFRQTRNFEMQDNFFVMEQALFQISESLQPPQEQQEMFVLWVDDEVEIIIN